LTRITWAVLLDVSKRIDWRIEQVLADGASFDFGRPFLPNTKGSSCRC